MFAQAIAWLVALAWVARVAGAVRGLPTIPDLLTDDYDTEPAGMPSITVIVPARNEQADVRACLESLLAQDYRALKIIAVNDRSIDATGPVMDSLACERLRVMHITELPPQWLGKTHAMASAAALAETDFLLFTDADILFRKDAIRRALVSAVRSGADHLVVAPTMIIRTWDEAALISFFIVIGMWAARAWKVADPKALRDAIGIGAFNMLRRTAYESIGGYEALRMEIVEDIGVARRVKMAGLAQRFVHGPGLVRVHWATGVLGLVNVMTKNIFAIFRFHVWLLAIGLVWLTLFCVMPFIAVWSRPFALPCAIAIAAIAMGYRLMSWTAGLRAWNVVLAPFAAALFMYAIVRSMVTTLVQGGVVWRGTFYPLAELRKYATPVIPRRRDGVR